MTGKDFHDLGKRIRTSLAGNAFLRIGVEEETADKAKHRNGIAPNFIHSYDASHLHLATVAGGAEGLSLAMIHDDYGTHADDGPADRVIDPIAKADLVLQVGGAEHDIERGVDE